MSLADQFLQDAGATEAPKKSLSEQFAADAAAAPAKSGPVSLADSPSLAKEVGRQVGLTARHAISGLTALPAMLGDGLNAGINSIFGTNLAPVSASIQTLADKAGLPQPKNGTERVVGDIASGMASVPTSLGLGGVLKGAASPTTQLVGRAMQTAPGMQVAASAGAGAGSGTTRELGLNPAWQIGGGIVGGGLGVLGGSLATAAVRAGAEKLMPKPPVTPEQAANKAAQGIDRVTSELGPQGAQNFPLPADSYTPQVAQSLAQSPKIDPSAAVRAQDFKTLGIQPTLGQITRDPMQFAGELNMRGVRGVGDQLTSRINQQQTLLRQQLYELSGVPSDTYQAGTTLKDTLRNFDDGLSKQVSAAYKAARASTGAELDVPLTGIAQDYANVLHNFGDKVPSGVRNNFEALGLQSGTQKKVFTFNDAENLLKVINSNMSADPATNASLDVLRKSVKNALLAADDQGGAFAQARQLAAKRFDLHDKIPALEASASNSINPDDFVRKFLTGGKTDQITPLAELLKGHDAAAFQEARSQIGKRLVSKAFGQNPAGDAPFNPSGFAAQMEAFGPSKLSAFYSPEELQQLQTIGRVGSYINSVPSSAPVNFSNTGSAMASLAGSGLKKIPYVGGLLENAQNKAFVTRALAGLLEDTAKKAPPASRSSLLDTYLLNQTVQPPHRN